MKEHLVIQLLHRQFTGELQGEEKSRLEEWLGNSADNRAYSDSIKQIWDLSANYRPSVDFTPDTDSAFNRFSNQISSGNTVQAVHDPVTVSSSSSSNLWKVIALGIGLIAISYLAFQVYNPSSNDIDVQYASLSTLSDQKEKLSLVDNSNVWVNEKSEIQYFEELDNNRVVQLEGEAFFDVQPSSKPFVIETPNATVTVLGTEFNVNASENTTRVHVKSGTVSLRPLNSNKSIELTANQIGVYDSTDKMLYRSQSKSYNGDSWRTGGFSFEDATLEEVFSTLEDHYNVDIYVQEQGLKNCVFTSPIYQDVSIEEVMSVMQVIYNFHFVEDEKIENRFIIEGGGCKR